MAVMIEVISTVTSKATFQRLSHHLAVRGR
jgi:hypothetical protein